MCFDILYNICLTHFLFQEQFSKMLSYIYIYIYIYIYTHTHTHTHRYIYIYHHINSLLSLSDLNQT